MLLSQSQTEHRGVVISFYLMRHMGIWKAKFLIKGKRYTSTLKFKDEAESSARELIDIILDA